MKSEKKKIAKMNIRRWYRMLGVRIHCMKSLSLFALSFCCVGLLGCVQDGPIEWDDERTNGKVIGFIDDSLAIVCDWRGWSQELDAFVTNNGGVRAGIGHQGLRVYNYRVQEEGPRWVDTLDNDNTEDFTYLAGQLSDSIIWGGDGTNSFSFWKLGEKPDLIDVEEIFDGCNGKFKQENMRTWLNGEIFVKGDFKVDENTCQYAILDTVAKTITYKRFSGDLKWIQDCDDVRAEEGEVYCLVVDARNGNSFITKNAKDSIFASIGLFHSGDFWGRMIKLNSRICWLENDEILCGDVRWYGERELTFKRDDGAIIQVK